MQLLQGMLLLSLKARRLGQSTEICSRPRLEGMGRFKKPRLSSQSDCVFNVVTKPLHALYSKRGHEVKSVAEARQVHARCVAGDWHIEFQAMVRSTMYCQDSLRQLRVTDEGRGDCVRRDDMSYEFLLVVMEERYANQLHYIESYPAIFSFYFAEGSEGGRKHVRADFLQTWNIILMGEEESLSDHSWGEFVADVFWVKWPAVRLAHSQNEREPVEDVDCDDGFVRTIRGITDRFGDSKGAEDERQTCS